MPYRCPTAGRGFGAAETWLEPAEVERVEARNAAATAHDLQLSERVGRALLRWLGLVLIALGCVACAPEGPACDITPQPGVTRAWCPDTLPTVRVVVDSAGCDAAMVRKAVAHWAPLADRWLIEAGQVPAKGGESYGEIYVSRGSLAHFDDGRVGNTHHYRRGRAMEWARITVEACSVQVIGHEMGHALGYSHSADVRDLMHDLLYRESWDVPVEMFGAMDRAQGLVPGAR